jgi:hypothetical protein
MVALRFLLVFLPHVPGSDEPLAMMTTIDSAALTTAALSDHHGAGP